MWKIRIKNKKTSKQELRGTENEGRVRKDTEIRG